MVGSHWWGCAERRVLWLSPWVAALLACGPHELPDKASAQAPDEGASQRGLASPAAPKNATRFTAEANAAVAMSLPFGDTQDFADARRGFVATLPQVNVTDDAGHPVFSLRGYEFLQQENAPSTINPSLWRIAQLNMNNGLFKVTDRIYQIRGFDLSNMTIVEGNTGLLVIDPLIIAETAKAGLALYHQHRPRKPVKAVIYTHSHVDHYGGVKGVVSEDDVKSGKVQILAPEGFLEEAVSENVYAGNAMVRRSVYMYGSAAPRAARRARSTPGSARPPRSRRLR